MLNAFLATGTALLRQRLPAASAVIIYTVSFPIENLHYPRHPFKDAEKWCREFRDLPSSSRHCIAFFQRKSLVAIQSLPSPRTAVFRAQRKYFSSRHILSTHQKHLRFIGKGFHCVYGACWKFPSKAFSFLPPYRCLSSRLLQVVYYSLLQLVESFVIHHFSANLFPHFAKAFPSSSSL